MLRSTAGSLQLGFAQCTTNSLNTRQWRSNPRARRKEGCSYPNDRVFCIRAYVILGSLCRIQSLSKKCNGGVKIIVSCSTPGEGSVNNNQADFRTPEQWLISAMLENVDQEPAITMFKKATAAQACASRVEIRGSAMHLRLGEL